MTIKATQFEVHPSAGVPIYLQIIGQINAMIAGGHLNVGDMLPSVRQMATELGVNAMTISKAYSKLEADEIVERVRGKGMQVRKSVPAGSSKERMQDLKPLMEQAVVQGRQLGLSNEQILAVANKLLQEYQP
ncbi:GntR family transcriptional regulator [Gimesia algae]|uniref:HTH-type transcriptional repressor YtrA n=1 Tax=Gimesia algae TaxID=2527971 RepID=A0A517VGN1_9PLAN|nr:GntR family transcriptional regulator [Gimesia algae]QDT92169.1 HTH-type transcriptional repressor YtrA [Gimesia algae]